MRRGGHTGSRVVLLISWGLLLGSVSIMTASEPTPHLTVGSLTDTMPADLTVRRALVIGVGQCADLRVPDARLPVSDAKLFAKTLTDPRVGHFSSGKVSLLVGDDATLPNIRKEFSRLQHAAPDDVVVVYISSYVASEDGKVYWLTRETMSGNMADSALSHAELGLLLKTIPSRNVVVFLDGIDGAVAGIEAKLKRADLTGVLPVMACDGRGLMAYQHVGGRERSIDGIKHDLLTSCLIQGLRGAADGNGDGATSVAELWRYVRYQLGQEAIGGSSLPDPTILTGANFRPDRVFLTVNANPENVSRARIESLMKMLGQGLITGVEYDEARRLLTSRLLRDRERLERDIYADLADGRLDSDRARLALSAIAVDTQPDPARGTLFTSLPASMRNSLRMNLVLIPDGSFQMGSALPVNELSLRFGGPTDWFEPEYPRHLVRISKPFYMGECEVTVGQFRTFVEETSYRTDAEKGGQSFENGNRGGFTLLNPGNWGWRETASWRNPGFDQTDDDPVVLVSWNDADMFCKWLSARDNRDYRLPTEAEWEYACRAGGSSLYWWGDDFRDREGNEAGDQTRLVGWSAINDNACTHPVGRFRANGFGLYDIAGNVWEWCGDWYGRSYYSDSPITDPRARPSPPSA